MTKRLPKTKLIVIGSRNNEAANAIADTGTKLIKIEALAAPIAATPS